MPRAAADCHAPRRAAFVELDDNGAPLSYEPFLSGFLQWSASSNESVTAPPTFGRPADVEFLADGSMLVTNEQRGEIYRIYYKTTNWLLIVFVALGVVILLVVVGAVTYMRVRRPKQPYAPL